MSHHIEPNQRVRLKDHEPAMPGPGSVLKYVNPGTAGTVDSVSGEEVTVQWDSTITPEGWGKLWSTSAENLEPA